jgi:hypothetical protein
MAMSATERRIRDRERKAAQRAAAKAAGVPDPAVVYHAITEAFGFSMINADKRTWIKGEPWCPVNGTVVIAAAVDVLVDRCRCNRDAAMTAVKQALAPRDSWRYPDYTPSSNPAPGRTRYRLQAPDQVVVRMKLANTPVTSSGQV